MSREIKFRAWNGSAMIMPDDKSYYQHYLSFCGNIVQKSSEGMACFGGNDSWRVIRKLELMQFTGLRDANGVEIYEGDVLKLEHGKHYWIYVVSVIDGFGSLLFACEIENNLSVDSESDRFTFQKQPVKLGSRRDFVSDRMRVIGNVFEHPHLLDEAK